MRAHLLGLGEERAALRGQGPRSRPDAPVDVNLLRDWEEWRTGVRVRGRPVTPAGWCWWTATCSRTGASPRRWLADAAGRRGGSRGVTLVGVTKHSSLSRGGAPAARPAGTSRPSPPSGPRACWWVPVARTRPDVGPGIQVVVARLDPDARFSFRVDLPGACRRPAECSAALARSGRRRRLPRLPLPAERRRPPGRLPGWVREEVWDQIRAGLDQAGVPADVQERAFADRHRLMERA